MAVIKTCCGCLSTKTGTYSVLGLHFLAYLASIIQLSISIANNELQYFWNNTVLTSQLYQHCTNTEYNSTWRCTTLENIGQDTQWVSIGLIVTTCFLLVACIIAIVGTVKDLPWLLMPWIALDFMGFVAKLVWGVVAMTLWTYAMKIELTDSSFMIAVAILVAVGFALHFYLWLCVVSFYQSLRELKELGFLDGGGKAGNDVRPFRRESESSVGVVTSTEDVKSVTSKDDNDESDRDGSDDEDDDSDSDEESADDDDDVENPKDESDKEDEEAGAGGGGWDKEQGAPKED